MGKKFVPKIPKRPVLKRETYTIPSSYKSAYEKAGVTNIDEQMMLFYTTQFGGFKFKRLPGDIEVDEEFLKNGLKKNMKDAIIILEPVLIFFQILVV
jgi:hypothetical protein